MNARQSRSAELAASGRIRVLACVRHYLPGFKSGGPVRTISNLVAHLGDEIDFRIVTSDRDFQAHAPYPNVAADTWQAVGKAQVYYTQPPSQSLARMAEVLNGVDYDVLYLNSFFDSRFTILPLAARRLGLLRDRPVIIAPRGEFSRSALAFRSWKKRPYMMMADWLALHADAWWHASSELEKNDIGRVLGRRAEERTLIAINLPQRSTPADPGGEWRPRQPHEPLRVVFLSRVSPIKNLDYALRVVAESSAPLVFHIYGAVDDQAHWARCQELIAGMPTHVTVRYHGELPHEQVAAALARADLFILPTQSENYGHAIAEALTQGTPVLISDRTPWTGLSEAGVGWDLPLKESRRLFVAAVEAVAAMPPEEYVAMRKRAIAFAARRLISDEVLEANRRIFTVAARSAAR